MGRGTVEPKGVRLQTKGRDSYGILPLKDNCSIRTSYFPCLAVSCNLRIATDFDDLINTTVFNKQRDMSKSDALSGGSTQNVTVRVVDGVADNQYYATLICTDEVDNPSRVSNIARFTLTGIITGSTSSTPSASGKNTGQMMTVMTTTVVCLLVVM